MRSLKAFSLVILLLLLVALVLLFVLGNQQAVTLVLFGWSAPSSPLALVVAVTFLVGLIIGSLVVFCAKRRFR